MVLLGQRPPEVENRAVPVNWEGDLIVGKKPLSAITTLMERQTRIIMLRRSLTWDRGKVMGNYANVTVETGVQVNLFDPRSPWQRATNEISNGLRRQYFPKGTDLSGHTHSVNSTKLLPSWTPTLDKRFSGAHHSNRSPALSR